MAAQKFKTTYDSWTFLFYLLLGLMLFFSLFLDEKDSLSFSIFALVLWFYFLYDSLFQTHYEISKYGLIVKFGLLFNQKYKLSEILRVVPHQGDIPFWAFKPKLRGYGKNGLILYLQHKRYIYISPKDRAKFVAELKYHNSKINTGRLQFD